MADALIRVLAEGHNGARCRGCGAAITWFTTVSGRAMPFTGVPVIERHEQDADGRRVLFLRSSAAHWATCPQADRFRKGKGGR